MGDRRRSMSAEDPKACLAELGAGQARRSVGGRSGESSPSLVRGNHSPPAINRRRSMSCSLPDSARARGARIRAPLDVRLLPLALESSHSSGDEGGLGSFQNRRCFRVGTTLGHTAPRLVDRSSAFKQSSGRMRVRRINDSGSTRQLRREDFFHTLVNMSTPKVLGITAAVLVLSWLIFACAFYAVSAECGLQVKTFIGALYLAIETVETIGYGVPDPQMNQCLSGVAVLALAALWASLLNAVLISLVYTRISRAQVRASSICFTEKAVISEINGDCYFMFQVFDFRKHQLCEAHVRLYNVQHAETAGGVTFQTRYMRLQHPDDELGGFLLLALPQLVVHRIDAWSPLCPPQCRKREGGTPASSYFGFPEIPQRSCDGRNGNRDASAQQGPPPPRPTLEAIARHLQHAQMEILCVVEGVEPATSGTLQARCSYTNDDIVFNACFQRCVSRAADGQCEVNLDAFHEIVQLQDSGQMLVQSMP